MPQRKEQVVGRKESPLEVVGQDKFAYFSQEEGTYTSDIPEYHYYAELFRGFFEKLTRWNVIFEDDRFRRSQLSYPLFDSDGETILKYRDVSNYKDFRVLQTQQGLAISSLSPDKYGTFEEVAKKPGSALIMTRQGDFNDSTTRSISFIIRPGEYGFLDPNGEPLREVEIRVGERKPPYPLYQELLISAEYPPPDDYTPSCNVAVRYELVEQTLRVSRYLFFPIMPDSYVAHLFNSIDALIPNTTSPTPQNERRVISETLPALPPPRRPAGQ